MIRRWRQPKASEEEQQAQSEYNIKSKQQCTDDLNKCKEDMTMSYFLKLTQRYNAHDLIKVFRDKEKKNSAVIEMRGRIEKRQRELQGEQQSPVDSNQVAMRQM